MAAMTVSNVLKTCNTVDILQKQDEIQAKFDEIQNKMDELTELQSTMTRMKQILSKLIASSDEKHATIPDWLSTEKFPAELSVEPTKIIKVHDWADMMFNAFGIGPCHDTTQEMEHIQDILYTLQIWKEKNEWKPQGRGVVDGVKMTRLALSSQCAYYEGHCWSGAEIYTTTDGITFELWMHEYEQYPSCYPKLLQGKLEEGPNKGSEFVYLTSQGTMCTQVQLDNGEMCWMEDMSKKVPEEVRAIDEECD